MLRLNKNSGIKRVSGNRNRPFFDTIDVKSMI